MLFTPFANMGDKIPGYANHILEAVCIYSCYTQYKVVFLEVRRTDKVPGRR